MGGCRGGQWKGDVMVSDSVSSAPHQPSVSHLLTHHHLEAGYQLLGRDLGFQIPNYILPLDTHDLIHHVGLELQLHHWAGVRERDRDPWPQISPGRRS